MWMLALTVLRLPPGLQPVGSERGDHVLYAMVARLLHQLVVRLRRVTHEALLLLLVDERRGGGELRVNAEGNSSHSSSRAPAQWTWRAICDRGALNTN